MKFISMSVMALVVLNGCASHKDEKVVVKPIVEREYVNVKPVKRDVTTQLKGLEQAGAAMAQPHYSVVLGKRRYGIMDDSDVKVNEEINSKYSKSDNNESKEAGEKTETSNSSKKDKSIYAK